MRLNYALLVAELMPVLDGYQAQQANDLLRRLKHREISDKGFECLLRKIVKDHEFRMALLRLKSQREIIRSEENASDQAALQLQVSIQQKNQLIPPAEMRDNPMVLPHLKFAHTLNPTYESASGIRDQPDIMGGLVANAPDQFALQSELSIQQQNMLTLSAEMHEKPKALQQMQFAHVPVSTHESAGEIQHQLDQMLNTNMPTETSSKTPTKKCKGGREKPLDDLVSSSPLSRKKENISATFLDQSVKQLNDATSVIGVDLRLTSNMPAATSSRKPKVGKQKPRKKQKVSGTFLDQSFEQLNDVTSVSGINLMEEEELLFSGPKRDSLVAESSQLIMQGEDDVLILEKIPLKQKLNEIVSKHGLKGFGRNVEQCLSLGVEERMCGLIRNLIRMSKQRLDVEKPRHRTVVTSDIGHQIMLLNRKAQDERKMKLAEGEKLQKLNESEGYPGNIREKEKDGNHGKAAKMSLTAANVAARDSLGGDDMLSRWQIMAEIAKQKGGGTNSGHVPQPGKDIDQKMNTPKDLAGGTKKGRSQGFDSQPRTICVEDVIAALERELQMSKSTLIYELYEKIPSNAAIGT